MRYLILASTLALAGCFATTGELDKAVADISDRIAVVANDAAESSEAVREAWRRGEIDAVEMEKRLQDIRAANIVLAKEAAREEFGELKETIKAHPEVVAQTTGDVLGTILPGPWGEIIGMAGAAAAAYFAASKKSKRDAEDVLWDARHEAQERELVRLKEAKK